MKRALFYLIQWSWGLPQNLLGLLLRLLWRKERQERYGASSVSYVRGIKGGLSLGCFLFLDAGISAERLPRLLAHEYGHTVQSLILGPLYIPVISIPSAVWCNLPFFVRLRKEKGIDYYSLYCERWADKLGGADGIG